MNPDTLSKILIIDDDRDIQDVYQEVLKNEGYKVDYAINGKEGLEKIYQGGYDLILLDIMMPQIDGISVLEKLNVKPPDRYNGPIFVLSQLNQQEIVDKAKSLGAKGYLVKSQMTPDQVLTTIAQILKESSTPPNTPPSS